MIQANKSYTKQFAFIAFSLMVTLFSSCYYDKEDLLYPNSNQAVDCATIGAKFAADIQPIINAQCATAGCHNASAAGGVTLMTYAQISAAKDRINARAVVQKTMPTSGPLSTTEINKIKCWIDGGALNN
jgi:uncharacterized membrane protein